MSQFLPLLLLILFFQGVMSSVQIMRYKKEIKRMRGDNRLLGVGARKNGLGAGSLILIAVDPQTKIVQSCKLMKGMTVFSLFKELPQYEGLPLCKLRERGLDEDGRINGAYRLKHPYDPNVMDKRKGALIQAVEVVDRQLDALGREEEDLSLQSALRAV